MSTPLRLVLFDVDGTLVDSQGSIVGAMSAAFSEIGLTAPERSDILSIVGLSLDYAMAELAPEAPARVRDDLVEAYKSAYHAQRLRDGAAHSPLYPGARDALDWLSGLPEVLLGVATGKSKRGLDALLDVHGLDNMFITRQVADHHPSKPHPSMVQTAMSETGMNPDETVVIGDTTYDIEMARAAGVPAIGVTWGYHAAETLSEARLLIDSFAELPRALEEIWKEQG